MNVMLRKHKFDFDLIVIGSGAGGSVGAHFAHSLGKKVAIFEKGKVGGECPNFACVPTKALLHAAKVYLAVQNSQNFGVEVGSVKLNLEKIKSWRDLVVSRTGATHGEEVFKKEGLHLIKEAAELVSKHEVKAKDKIYTTSKILIASGTTVAVPPVPGLEKSGYITFKEAGSVKKLPASIFILGGGPVGCEFAQIFASLGSKVIIADIVDRLLIRDETETSELIKAIFENQGIEVLTGIKVNKIEKKAGKKIIHYQSGGHHHREEVEEILVATGKKPVLDFGLKKAGIKVENGHLKVNKYLQTNVPNIYAAGDVIGPYQFTHTGEYQSYIAARNAFSLKKIKADYNVVPKCVFTFPEVASVGILENQAKEMGIKIKVGIVSTAQFGRANTSNEFDGFVKVITDKKGTIIGASIVAPSAGEIIHELALAIRLKAKAKILAEMIHAYPTFSEAVKVACSSLENR